MKRISLNVLLILVMLGVMGATPTTTTFAVPLSGDEEVPPRETRARGTAVLQFNADATELSYMLIAANVHNVVAAHIHCAPAGVNGPVGLTLFSGGQAGGGRFDGVLVQTTKFAPDPGNACGWVTLADVLAAIQTGNTYVNLHTNDGVAPPNTGPGDFPGGEIRGQID